MSAWAYAVGVVALAAMLAPVAWVSVMVCDRWLPDWHGSHRALALAIVGIATLIGIAQALGTVGLFRRWPMVTACLLLGLLVWQWVHRSAPGRDLGSPCTLELPPLRRPFVLVSAIVTAVVVAHWLGATATSFRYGMSEIDSLNYHGSFAARFIQTGWVTRLDHNAGNAIFYPANGELVDAIAMLSFHRDLLLPLVNLGWLAVTLLAGWCAGRPFGAAPVTMAGVALVLSSPLLIASNAGTAGNDIAMLALILSTVAILLREPRRPAELALVGAAAGLAMGTKLTALPPLAVLVVVLALFLRKETRRGLLRRRQTLAVLVPSIALGSIWYVRNVVIAGSPLPWLRLGIGPLALPQLAHPDPGQALGVPLYRYALQSDHWTELRRGLTFGYGPAGWLVLVLAIGGLVATAVAAPTGRRRLVAGFGIVAALAYVANPISAGGVGAQGGFFQVNLRYLLPVLVTGIVLLPILPALARGRAAILGVCAVGVVATIHGYPDTFGVNRVQPLGWAALVVAAGFALLIGALTFTGRATRSPFAGEVRWLPIAVIVVLVVGAGWVGQGRTARTRYRERPPREISATATEYRSNRAAFRWARQRRHARIAVDGNPVYPLYGADLTNHVERVIERLGRGDSIPIDDCRSWRRALVAGRFDAVVVFKSSFGVPDSLGWTRTIAGVRPVASDARSEVLRLPSKVSEAGCPAG